jgi:hypothetical protein
LLLSIDQSLPTASIAACNRLLVGVLQEEEKNITMFIPVSSRTRAAREAASSDPFQHQEKPIDHPLLDSWDQLLKAPSLEGRNDNGNDSRQECVFEGISISKELLHAFKRELTAVQKNVLTLGLMTILYDDEPMKKANREGNKITAEFGDDSKLNIHKAWRVVCEVNNNDEMRMLRVEGSDGKAMAELNLDSSDVTSSKSVPSPPPHRSAVQNRLLNAFASEASTPRKRRQAAMENADEAMQRGSKKTLRAPAIGLPMIVDANLMQANITSYVGAYFAKTLKNILTTDLVTEDPTPDQKADNTYRASWVLPAKKRFFAALLQTAYDACKHHEIDITPENSHTILQHAFLALQEETQQEKEINKSLIAAHQSTNDSQSALTMSEAMKGLPRFTEISKVNDIFQRVVDRIKEINPNQEEVDPLQMWRHCVDRCTIDYLQEEKLPFDRDNPFLLYIEDTDKKSSLLNSANAWDLITQNVDQDLTPELLMKLWDIHSNNGTPSDKENISMPSDNGNSTCLMMRDDDSGNAAHATLTKEGLRELKEKIKFIKKKYGDEAIFLGHKEDKKDSTEYGKTVVTLRRPGTNVVNWQNRLEDAVKNYNAWIAAAGEDKEKLLAAEFELGMDLTQCRLLPDENITVGKILNNFLRLKNKQSVPFSLPNHDKLDGYTLGQIMEIAKQEELGDD